MADTSVLFKEGRIGKLTLKNRIVKSPQCTALSNPDGTVSPRTVNHYKRLAEGGVGLVLLEYSYVDDDAAKSIHNQIGLSQREHIAGLGWLVDEVHAAGAKVGIQLAHCGRQRLLGTAPIKSASDVSWDKIEQQYGVKPQPMTTSEIEQVVRAFGDAALRAVKARFDLVEVHAGHGYLITNFLSPHTNRRTDDYGVTFENRSRLLLEIIADIRNKIPRDFPVSVRLSVTDYEVDGIPIDETVALCRKLELAGVDVIHASGGHHARMEYEVSPWYMPRAPHRWGWEEIKSSISIPVIGSGSIVAPDVAAEIISSGSADYVSLGRAMLADPDWARKTHENRIQDIVPCIRCNDGCLHRGLHEGRSAGCSVNPSMGEEYRYPVGLAPSPRNVAVIGAGVAGMKAATVLADRGHNVTLFDGKPLGGQLNAAVRSSSKQDLRALRDHLAYQVQKRNIRIMMQPATLEYLVQGDFDKIYFATGTRPRTFDGPVAEGAQVAFAQDIHDPAALEGPVVIIGAGMAGCDTALWLAQSGRNDVCLIEAQELALANGYVFTDVGGMPPMLARYGIDIKLNTKALVIDAQAIRVQDPILGEQSIEAGSVVLACGYGRETALYDKIKDNYPDMDVELLGTAYREGRVMDALHHAFFAARRY
ncbi:oxidoreductase [Eoetvoesiella caeni]